MKNILKGILIGLGILLLLGYVAGNLHVFAAEDKFDGECTGQETAGRCADKCPEGSYNIGISKDGAALCKLNPTGCPYGDSIPLGAECDKQAPKVEAAVTTPVESVSSDYPEDFQGK